MKKRKASFMLSEMPYKDLEYKGVRVSDDEDDQEFVYPTATYSSRFSKSNIAIVILSSLVCVLSILLAYTYFYVQSRYPNSQLLYSPLQHLVEYEARRFHFDIDPKFTTYDGTPSKATDAAWEQLDVGPVKITAEEASLLPNQTWPMIQEPGYYLANIDVFHHIHCLNRVRKALRSEHYVPTYMSAESAEIDLGESHIAHCIDAIRQSLMCHSDISVLVWQWVERDKLAEPLGHVMHTCRNFDPIWEWGNERKMSPGYVLDETTDLRGNDALAGTAVMEELV